MEEMFFELLRYSLDEGAGFRAKPTEKEWGAIYEQAVRQSLVALMYVGANRLRDGQQPPFGLMMRWASEAEDVNSLNRLLNSESRRLTALFEHEGHHTLILKGQANARLYPDKLCRQPGDIDIYVDGGEQAVAELLKRLKMTDEPKTWGHHFALPETPDGVEVEVHFRYAHGGRNAKYRERLMSYLQQLLAAQGATLCEEGFRTPPLSFALAMQLSHIQQHVVNSGIGLRQMVDYYVLLRHASDEERRQLQRQLGYLGLTHVARALMWILHEKLQMPECMLIARGDARRGEWLLRKALAEGNFGFYREKDSSGPRLIRFLRRYKRSAQQIWMCPYEAGGIISQESELWLYLLKSIPRRIRAGRFYLSEW